MQLVWDERSYPITGGFVLSVLFHLALALLIIIGIPVFFHAPPPTPQGIQATIVSDITAAPKVDKLGKPQEKPKPPQPPAPEQKKPEPPKPAPPVTPTPAAPPPPQAAPEKAVEVPDETKKAIEPKKEEKKPEEKKPEKKPEEKPKPKQDNQQASMDALLKNLAKEQPAPDTKEKTKPKAQPAAAQPTTGPQAPNINDVPMTASEEDAIRAAVEQHWSTPIGMANIESYTILLRLYMNPDGTVSKMELLDPSLSDPGYRTLSESAKLAVELAVRDLGRLPMPANKNYPTILLRFDMKEVCADMGGC